jgi:hypothetical protein
MFNQLDANDPFSTAAAALHGAEALAPLVRHRLPGLIADPVSDECSRVADLLDSPGLFERPSLAVLRGFLARLDAVIDELVIERRDWVPVRCVDGYEEFEEVTVRERDTRADAVIAIAGQLERVIELAARTVALRRAAALVGGTR